MHHADFPFTGGSKETLLGPHPLTQLLTDLERVIINADETRGVSSTTIDTTTEPNDKFLADLVTQIV
jgi:hypothetical protein